MKVSFRLVTFLALLTATALGASPWLSPELDPGGSVAEPGAVPAPSSGLPILDWTAGTAPQRHYASFTLRLRQPTPTGGIVTYGAARIEWRSQDGKWSELEPPTTPLAVRPLPEGTPVHEIRVTVPAQPGAGPDALAWQARLPWLALTRPGLGANLAADASVLASSASPESTGFQPQPWLNRPATLTDGFVDERRNFKTAARGTPLSPQDPESFLVDWGTERPVGALVFLRGRDDPGLAAPLLERFTGTGEPRFAMASDKDWTALPLAGAYPCAFRHGTAMAWPEPFQTRALRIRCVEGLAPVGVGEILVLGPPAARPGAASSPVPGIPVELATAGKLTLQLRDADGNVVANPVAGVAYPAGSHRVAWDLNDLDGRPVLRPGTYRWSGLLVPGLELVPLFSYYPTPVAGMPWHTEDGHGGWLADHEAPRSIARAGDRMVLAAFGEAGHSFVETDADANKRWGIDRVWLSNPSEICVAGDSLYAWCEGHWLKEGQTIVEVRLADKAQRKILAQQGPKADIPEAEHRLSPAKRGCTGFQVVGHLAFVAFGALDTVQVFDISKGLAGPLRNFGWDIVGKQFEDQKPILAGEIALPVPGRLRADGASHVVAVTREAVVRIDVATLTPQTLFRHGMERPLGLGLDPATGRIAIGDGTRHQVLVFDRTGQRLATLGKPGRREVGPFDPDDLEEPYGVEFGPDGRLWVMEHTDFPRRVSLWDIPSGHCVKAVHGPTQYGGGGCVDPEDLHRTFYKGLEFRIGADGSSTPANLVYRPDSTRYARFPDGDYPAYAFRSRGALWFTSYMHPHSHPSLVLWRYDEARHHVMPVAAVGSAVALRLAFGEPLANRRDAKDYADTSFLTRHVPGYREDQKLFTWTDLDGDGRVQASELTFGGLRSTSSGRPLTHASANWNWRMNGDFVASASVGEGRIVTFRPKGFTVSGLPLYDVPDRTIPGGGEAFAVDAQGNTVMLGSPLRSVDPEGRTRWAYRNEWPGLHAGHRTTARGDEPGVLIAPTRIWGLEPAGDELGEVLAFNSNLGATYLMTARDGLFIDRVFQDQRIGLLWRFPAMPSPDVLAETSLYDEHFGGIFQRVRDAEGRERFVYVVGKTWCTVVELRGLDRVRRLAGGTVEVTPEHIAAAQARRIEEARRTAPPKRYTIVRHTPSVDAEAGDWEGIPAIDDFRLAYDADNLYVLFNGKDDRAPFENKGDNPLEIFKTGDVLDVMLQTRAEAPPDRIDAGPGDVRLALSMFEGRPVAVLYDFRVPGFTGEPVAFSSPWRTITCDRVGILDGARVEVRRQGTDITVEAAVPLAALHLDPGALRTTRGDVGRVWSDQTGTASVRRSYWSNQNTAITSDLPSEAGLQPALWGQFTFAGP